MTVYFIVGGLVILVAAGAFAYFAGRKTGTATTERDQLKDDLGKRRKGDAVMSEPVADEHGWLARSRERLHRMQDDSKS